MSALGYIDSTIIICIIYLLFLLKKNSNRLLIPSTIHTITWLIVCVLIHATITGLIGEYGDLCDSAHSYDYVSPLICGIVVSSIIGFSLSHKFLENSVYKTVRLDSNEKLKDTVDYVLRKYHWILYLCLLVGIVQTIFISSVIGFENIGDYRVAAVTIKRVGYGAIAQQIAGHVTILGTFYFALLGYKQSHDGLNLKRFLLDAFMLASTNLAIAGRGWIITVTVPYFITYFWQKNLLNEKFFTKDMKKVLLILFFALFSFSIIGLIRNDNGQVRKDRAFDTFLYYTDGSRITNFTLANMPENTIELEYGKCEFLSKWVGSTNSAKLESLKEDDYGLSVTVSSALPYLYFDFGFWGGIFMWGVFCFFIEWFALKMRYKKTLFSVLIFMELAKLLYQAPIGPIFVMEVPIIEWLIILYILRKPLFKIA